MATKKKATKRSEVHPAIRKLGFPPEVEKAIEDIRTEVWNAAVSLCAQVAQSRAHFLGFPIAACWDWSKAIKECARPTSYKEEDSDFTSARKNIMITTYEANKYVVIVPAPSGLPDRFTVYRLPYRPSQGVKIIGREVDMGLALALAGKEEFGDG